MDFLSSYPHLYMTCLTKKFEESQQTHQQTTHPDCKLHQQQKSLTHTLTVKISSDSSPASCLCIFSKR